MAESSGFPTPPTRRGVVAAAGGVGLAAVLTACGSGSSDDASSGSSTSQAPTTDAGSGAGSSAPGGSGSGSGGGTPLARTSDIPVGGGKVFADQKVVVTQPSSGQFKGFSAVCTHQGCTVSKVSDGLIVCPCHGSTFRVADGTVANGPATSALPAKQVSVSGDEITLG